RRRGRPGHRLWNSTQFWESRRPSDRIARLVQWVGIRCSPSTDKHKGYPRGLSHQEAPQAYVEEEAPQAASQDTSPASQQEVRPRRQSCAPARVISRRGLLQPMRSEPRLSKPSTRASPATNAHSRARPAPRRPPAETEERQKTGTT